MIKIIFRWLIRSILALLFIIVSYIAINIVASANNYVLPWNVSEAFEITQSWGGLAKFPQDAEFTSIKEFGGMFSHIFDIEFTASSTSIDEWIKNSKRLKDNIPENLGGETYKYSIHPGENGAQGGWVEINKLKSKVKIHIYWS